MPASHANRTDLDSLATKLAKDRGYANTSPFPEALGGFVCPRANAYGGREGIIPPGIAAQRGLVPARMTHIAVADTAKTAIAAATDGKTEAERYRDYYETQTREQVPVQITARVTDVSPVRETTCPSPTSRQLEETPAGDTPTDTRISASNTAETATSQRIRRDKVFSRGDFASADEDTLDGFYESLKSAELGTSHTVHPDPKALSDADLGDGKRHAVEVTSAGLRLHDDASRAAGERAVSRTAEHLCSRAEDYLAGALQEALARVTALERSHAELTRERDNLKEANDDLVRQLKERAPLPGETVRVVLSKEEERLRIGGARWDVKLVGALHYGRPGSMTVVLTVSDPAYASELLARMQPGPVGLLSSVRRLSCMYTGICDKIYGESDSADFISVFRFAVDESTPVTGG